MSAPADTSLRSLRMFHKPQVLVVLLDAAEKDLELAWAEAGELPTLRRLLDRGACVVTQGPLGMHAAAGWHSLFTAVSPARHGHHGDRQIRLGTYEMYRFLPRDIKREPFWNVLGRGGRRVAVLDVPYVALSEHLNGIHVVDWTTHAADNGFATWPPELARRLRDEFGGDFIGLCDHKRLDDTSALIAFRDALVAKVGIKVAAARALLRQEPWDMFLVTFGESHCIGHQCWHLHDPTHPRHNPAMARAIGDPMLTVYRALDDGIARLLQEVGPETTVLVVCTHGMGPNHTGAHLLGEILARLGHRAPPRPARWPWRAARWAWRRLPVALRARMTPAQKAGVDIFWPAFDRHAKCVEMPNGEVYGAIRVNLAGREPEGMVQPGGDYDRFCEALTADLCGVLNSETGRPAVRRVLRTADLYSGPYLDELPDLLVEWQGDAPLNVVHSPKIGTIRSAVPGPRSGHHRPQGLVVAAGPGIPHCRVEQPASVMDIAPTIAALLGVELPDVDGRAIQACLPDVGASR